MAKSMTISSIGQIPEVKTYLDRVGAEPRSLLTAVVREVTGDYWKDIAVIRFKRNGDVDAPKGFEPTDTEIQQIKAVFEKYELPEHRFVKSLKRLPENLKSVAKKDLFVFKNTSGDIIMLQQRRMSKKGERTYVPWTYWSDNEWRPMEPEGALPLYGLDTIGDNTTVFIHEGAKAARAMQEMLADKRKRAAHPWGEELDGAAHIGWIGGALSPKRTDWGVLAKMGVKRAYIVSDNDSVGIRAVPEISYRLRMPTYHVQFARDFPASFDLADPFPEHMFKTVNGVRHYAGPTFRDCVNPATWATDQIPSASGKGKPRVVLRDHFIDQWVYAEQADLVVCVDDPTIAYPERIANKVMSPFSHTRQTAALLEKAYSGRVVGLCYEPDKPAGMIIHDGQSALNLFEGSNVKPVKGDIKPFMEYLAYMFPNERECHEVKRWIATLIARPDIRMSYSLLLVSETQGIGKTTLGMNILRPLVGYHNTSSPSENTIVNSEFTSWIGNKRLVVVNEIYSGHSWKAYNRLKSYITDDHVTINEKFQTPYMVSNWAHFIAMSNSRRALKMEQDDRRWFYPKITETPWPVSKFEKLHSWLQGGGLQVIRYWAENEWTDFVAKGERAPMTETKKEMIEESKTEAQQLASGLAKTVSEMNEPVLLAIKDVAAWTRSKVDGKVFDTDYELKKSMVETGLKTIKDRLFLHGVYQHVLFNSAAEKLIDGKTPKERLAIAKRVIRAPDEIGTM